MSREIVKSILSHFEKLTQIPRPTRGEEKVAEHIINWAKENNFESKKDEVGNVYIYVPASSGKENYPTITIQGHMDMVCEKTPESKIDPSKDPLKLIYDKEWLKADGTTLGADNGVAIAFAMELALNKEVSHPPLELFFTVAEEEGFDGVNGLKPNTLKGRYLLNLDSDDNSGFTIASASTLTMSGKLKINKTNLPDNLNFYELVFDGALGGHSGIDIAKKRSNANMALMYSLKEVAEKIDIYFIDYEGGTRRNVIPRKARAVVAIDCTKDSEFRSIIAECEKYIKNKYTEDKNPHIQINKAEKVKDGVTKEDSKKIIDFITSLPNGLESMSKTLADTIEASNNIAIVKLEDDNTISVKSMQRGATTEGLMRVTKKIDDVFVKFGCIDIEKQKTVSKPWEPNPESKLVKLSVAVFKKIFNKEPKLIATHGGLECATIGEKHPNMDMISFGAIIEDLHSPEERLNILSIEPTWELFKGIVEIIE